MHRQHFYSLRSFAEWICIGTMNEVHCASRNQDVTLERESRLKRDLDLDELKRLQLFCPRSQLTYVRILVWNIVTSIAFPPEIFRYKEEISKIKCNYSNDFQLLRKHAKRDAIFFFFTEKLNDKIYSDAIKIQIEIPAEKESKIWESHATHLRRDANRDEPILPRLTKRN